MAQPQSEPVQADRGDDGAGCIVTYYNGACPVCRAGIEATRATAERRGAADMAWTDIAADPGVLDPLGLQRDRVRKRLQVRDRDGRMAIGVDAAIVLWRAIPGKAWRARVIALPGLYHLSCFAYDRLLAQALFWWNRRKGRW